MASNSEPHLQNKKIPQRDRTASTPEPYLQKNDTVEVRIDGFGYEGEGVAHINGYTVFVPFALPGERVRAHVIFAKPTFAAAKLEKVLTPSPQRTQPFCPHFSKCGGCALQHVQYEAQLACKRDALKDSFFKTAKLTVEPLPVVQSPAVTAYRNKLSLPVRGAVPQLGFFAPRSHRLVPVESCPIQFEGHDRLIGTVRGFLQDNGIGGYNEETGTGLVRHLVARKLADTLTVTLVLNADTEADAGRFVPLYALLEKQFGQSVALYANFNTSRGNAILGKTSVLLGGTPRPACVDGLQTRVHPQSFFQVNDGVRALLYAAVLSEVGEHKTVLDAYSGAGLLSALLTQRHNAVTQIEIEPAATQSARLLFQNNGLSAPDTAFITGDCAALLPALLEKNRYDTVVLDPPRAGCAEAVTAALRARPVQKLVYVSCNGATLARDVARLLPAYTLQSLQPFDMFPHCAGLETLCVLTKKQCD